MPPIKGLHGLSASLAIFWDSGVAQPQFQIFELFHVYLGLIHARNLIQAYYFLELLK